MTATAAGPVPAPPVATGAGLRARHAVALGLLLVVAWVVTGPGVPFMSDEGQAELQVDLLEAGTWVYDSPFDEPGGLDPDRAAMAVRDQGETVEGATPYGKHPVYPTLLRLARLVAGGPGTVLVSIGAAVAAAWLAAALARELGARDPRVAFWLCGLASPLFFDGMIVFAHTIGAALAATALLALVRLDREAAHPDGGALRPAHLALLGGAVGAAVLFRNEALLLAVGLALAVLVVGRARLPRRLFLAAVPVLGAVGAALLDSALRHAILGSPARQAPPVASEGTGLAGRIDAARLTLLEVGSAVPGPLRAAFVLWLLALVATTYVAVRHPLRLPARVPAVVLGAGLLVHLLRLLTTGSAVIPGLVAAFPALAVLAVLLLTVRPTPPVRLVAVAVALTGGAVAALQYDRGGGLEWGGRFFAILLPALAALVVVQLERAPLPARSARTWTAGLLAIGVVTALGSVTALRTFRATADQLAGAVVEAAAVAGPLEPAVLPEGRPPRPLVVTAEVLVPRILQPVFTEVDWLAPEPAALGELGGRLETAGVDRFVVVTSDPAADLAALPAWDVEAEVPVGRGAIRVFVVSRPG